MHTHTHTHTHTTYESFSRECRISAHLAACQYKRGLPETCLLNSGNDTGMPIQREGEPVMARKQLHMHGNSTEHTRNSIR